MKNRIGRAGRLIDYEIFIGTRQGYSKSALAQMLGVTPSFVRDSLKRYPVLLTDVVISYQGSSMAYEASDAALMLDRPGRRFAIDRVRRRWEVPEQDADLWEIGRRDT